MSRRREALVGVALVVGVVLAFFAGRAHRDAPDAGDAIAADGTDSPSAHSEDGNGMHAPPRDAGAHHSTTSGDAGTPGAGGARVVIDLDEPPGAAAVAPPPVIDTTPRVVFDHPQTIEDEYDRATMLWDLVQARRVEIRAQLAEARRTGDQQSAERLAHQLELLDVSDREMEAAVHAVEARRAAAPSAPEAPAEPPAPAP